MTRAEKEFLAFIVPAIRAIWAAETPEEIARLPEVLSKQGIIGPWQDWLLSLSRRNIGFFGPLRRLCTKN